MRTIRTLMTAVAIGAMLPSLSAAQRDRDFKDAWFWGFKVGGLSIADSGSGYVQAPTVGLDWMITRTHGGVYMAGSQTFFSQHTFIPIDPAVADSGFRSVHLKNLRRFDVVAMGFPGQYKKWHPYIGAGFGIAQVGTATPEGVFSSADQLVLTQAIIDETRTTIAPVFMAGAQFRLRYFSAFGQLSLSPSQRSFLLYNGRPLNFGYEIGLRYNLSSSVEKEF